ncbi:MAG: beta-lactamase family protein [Lachnospiraceae bacterium]|nr:beta-lactamase family protein [Lachnospiraceae bacterium]
MYHFEPLTAYIDHLHANFLIPAADVMIIQDGETVYRHFAGTSDLEGKVPMTGKEMYAIYSATKVSTIAAAMRLIEDGGLALDDPVEKYLPAYGKLTIKNNDGTSRPAKNVLTVRHLMSMQGGLDYDTKRGDVKKVLRKNPEAGTVDIVSAYAKGPLAFEPGTRYKYSLCHDVLAAVVEKASGMRYSDYLTEKILAPLGMKNTTFHPTEEQDALACRLFMKNDAQDKLIDCGIYPENTLSPNYESGGGGLMSTVEDYAELAYALANFGCGRNGAEILSPESVELMRTPQLRELQQADFLATYPYMRGYTYCLGVRRLMNTEGTLSAKGHFGWDGAAGFYVLSDPENGIAVIYAQNVLNSRDTFFLIQKQIRDLAYFCLQEGEVN